MSKAALVTGGARRLGKEIAVALARAGYDIALHYGKTSPESSVAEIRSYGVKCDTFQADFSDPEAVDALLPAVLRQCENVELLVNSASVFDKGSIGDTETDLLRREFQINFFAPFQLSRDFYKLKNKGHIINIVDSNINKHHTKHAAYLLSKKTLAEFTKMAAVQFGPKMRVNAIAPGLILPPADQDEVYLKTRAEEVALKRKGELHEITDAIMFLEKNAYVTGQIIYIDGGGGL